ncbi:MAG: C39 family peptidase [Verrucomicrobia bacterium]|nr:C39 family peptidase [Verrucomicrobiota bacterium]
MKWSAWSLVLFLLAARAVRADDVALTTGPAITGTILQLTTNSILLLQADGTTRTQARDTVKSFSLDFPAGDRCARVTNRDGTSSLLVVSSFTNDHFAGKDLEGKPATLRLGELLEAELYPVARPRHILDVPYVRQKPDYCGEACVEMVSTFLDRPVSQDKVNELAGLAGKRGCHGEELAAVINKLELKIASAGSWPGATADDFVAERMRLLTCLRQNHPVLLGLWGNYQVQQAGWTFDHIVLLIGYDLASERFIIHDPGRWPDWEVSFADFIKHRQNGRGQLSQIEFALFRNWKTLDGTEIAAELLELNDQTMRLKPATADAITLAIDKLDPPGRAFLEKLKRGQQAPPSVELPPELMYARARECAQRGDKAAALTFLTRAVETGLINFALLQNDKALDSIREEPEFKALLAN